MKIRHTLLIVLPVVLIQLILTTASMAFWLVLPNVAPNSPPGSLLPPLGYLAESDNYGGAACVQMVLHSCPNVSDRPAVPHLQSNIYASIVSHNTEAGWFSDPSGILGALMDPALSPPPTSNWSDYKSSNRTFVLGKMLYWMKVQGYLTPILLGTNPPGEIENWVTVFGYECYPEPTSSTAAVALSLILYYDPFGTNIVSPPVLLNDSAYWQNPINRPGSAWDGTYVAIVEPPELTITVTVKEWILAGPILPPDDIERNFYRWRKKIREDEVAQGSLEILQKDIPIKKPVLVETPEYSYYLIAFEHDHLAAIFNAYDGSFEEFRYFYKPVKYVVDSQMVVSELEKAIAKCGAKVVEISTPKLLRNPASTTLSRIMPIWQTQAVIKDLAGNQHELQISLNSGGEVIEGLEAIENMIPGVGHAIPLPGDMPQGITWDGRQLWVIDGEAKKLHRIDFRSGAILKSLDIDAENPKRLAFGKGLLWVGDEGTKSIYAIDPNSGQLVTTIEMKTPQEKGYKSLEGITWDGKYLWTAFFAGFSSSFNQIDTDSGEIIRSIFADCHPRGISSEGRRLWSICYNGEKFPSKIDKRKILEKEHEMLGSRVFIGDIEGRDPIGLACDGKFLWYADRQLKQAFIYQAVNPEED